MSGLVTIDEANTLGAVTGWPSVIIGEISRNGQKIAQESESKEEDREEDKMLERSQEIVCTLQLLPVFDNQ